MLFQKRHTIPAHTEELTLPMKIMTIYAHPADTITNCGGALARHADAGDDIVAVILTHGGRIHPNKYAEEMRKDNPDPAIAAAGLQDIVDNKKDELRRAAEIIGIGTVVTLDHDDILNVLQEPMVAELAEVIAEHAPDIVICDYPKNPVSADSSHTIATMTALAAIQQAGQFLAHLDGQKEINVRQVFFTGLSVHNTDALSAYGMRNDMSVDITPVVGRKIAAMDGFVSQGYDGVFARKLVEANNGEAGRAAGVNFAEPYTRYRGETHELFPLTEQAKVTDPLTRHVSYSQINLRADYPVS
ncbi:PIG-L deacetylase family protein [Nakamurella lactea]|uniref:PIG-L deacetylase family protein n=1 Tax=Nakamurella lactea TaxID=459515 RepID=UPI0013768B29|nr:PIG-L family deacetylase [Nakamurella lactea]